MAGKAGSQNTGTNGVGGAASGLACGAGAVSRGLAFLAGAWADAAGARKIMPSKITTELNFMTLIPVH
ncbi:hypothetical protein EJB06_01725 [Massilia atriviolacea]|uniref:Uncharacterized protein n=1 Tax=Massilia atriviolacea TaxID=2495579 RepID=A0A430HTJ2_9BURK|nr:hypothetical protein EJB06_01725 [Massilia atriviolacea]